MKRILIFMAICLPLLTVAQRKPKIKGNREVTEVREELPPFNAIELNDNLEIQLKKSFGEGYEITADDNLVDILKFKVEDSTLVISSFYTVTAKKQFDITVNYRELKAITMRDGKITTPDIISADKLFVNVFGPAKINIKASAFVADLNMEDTSVGDFNFDVDSLNVNLRHKADATLYSATGANIVELADNANLTIDGTTDKLKLTTLNSAKFKGEKLQAANAAVRTEESGFVRLYATKELELYSSGDSRIHLYGEPRISILDFLDTSQLIKKQD
ncbi:DUF2807 domain-containing protein [uncultured Croceitalea sp.]|uniref:GIN domain-containing protein n=1 Tax=uncultured Croceitalea sp. TaxID=1798908 RepID=UPI00330675AB